MPNTYQEFLRMQIDRSKEFARFLENAPEPGAFARFQGLEGSARALLFARLQDRTDRPILIVAPDAESAEVWYDDFLHFGVRGVLHYPMTETLPYEQEEPVIGIVARQYSTLHYLLRGQKAELTKSAEENTDKNKKKKAKKGATQSPPLPLIVAPIEALQRKTLSPVEFQKRVLTLQWGESFDLDETVERLVEMGYERESMTEVRGEFSIRGHIIDIFPPQLDDPVRLDLFGDEIESMRYFDVTTQRSLPDSEEIESLTLFPPSLTALCERLAREERDSDETLEKIVPLDRWLSEETLLVLDAPDKYGDMLDQIDRITQRRYEDLSTPGKTNEDDPDHDPSDVLKYEALYLNHLEVQATFERFSQVRLPRLALQEAASAEAPEDYDFGVTSYESIPSNVESYLGVMKKKQWQDYSVHLVCDNEGQVARVQELMLEREIGARTVLPASPEATAFKKPDLLVGYQEVTLTTGLMHTGFIFPDAQLMVVTDREMFGRYKRRRLYKKVAKGRAIASSSEIQRGDFVVHVEHGIGQFLGIRKQNLDGRETELLEIEYAENSKLLVPIENVHYIQKFTSVEGATPPLDRLGGKRWQTRKRKSQERIEKMAEELLEIYAKREVAQGHVFGPDTIWQQEFEDSFLYNETPDQLRSIDEIKADMTGPKPMDRLLCGDVGFGKTEVAMRAVFKCFEEKKQIAILVPTTILAQQHFNTFTERFAEYPARIEMISRFRSPKEVKEVLKGLKTGEVHIVIGTHRLLSQDVQFLDLGLLVVDEEQRFGVKQKEKIKKMRASVDILSLSATPIPRTLHLALSGLRDMSTIHTAPRDRLPIRTQVIRFVPEEIEEAVVRELNRGGQIYFVHNRVKSIEDVAERLREIVPQARIGIGHGQMNERELERVMLDFIDRKYDILLATTIIENGLDIPNVNTIVINRADAFGLAQLYQLRGRVGRDVKRAYAYLIIPDGKPITDTAIKRLRAIEEFSELGTGFQIAMRDLEIRGTGNLLGSEQHGTIEMVGFELYCQMLEEAVRQRKGRSGDESLDQPTEINWPISAFLPSAYVPVESQRIAFYKRISLAREPQELEALSEELRDRYGKIPPEAENLIGVGRIRLQARQRHISKVTASAKGFKLTPRGDLFDFLGRALLLKDDHPEIKEIAAAQDGAILFEIKNWNREKGIETTLKILLDI